MCVVVFVLHKTRLCIVHLCVFSGSNNVDKVVRDLVLSLNDQQLFTPHTTSTASSSPTECFVHSVCQVIRTYVRIGGDEMSVDGILVDATDGLCLH